MFTITLTWNSLTWVPAGYRRGVKLGCPSQAGKPIVPLPGLNWIEPCPVPIHTSSTPHTFGTNCCPASLYRGGTFPLTGVLLFPTPPKPIPATHDEVRNGHDGCFVSSTIWKDHLVETLAVTLIVWRSTGFSIRESDIGETFAAEVHLSVPVSPVYAVPIILMLTPPLPSHA